MTNSRICYLLLALVLLVGGATGCGDGGKSSSAATNFGTVGGSAAKGLFTSGQAQAFKLIVSNGQLVKGAAITAAGPLTGSQFSLQLTEAYTGPFIVEVTGTYTDDSFTPARSVTLTSPLQGGGVFSGTTSQVNVTALNHIALARALVLAGADPNAFATALAQANTEVAQSFSLTANDLTSAGTLAATTAALTRIDNNGATAGIGDDRAFDVVKALAAFFAGGSVAAGTLATGQTVNSVATTVLTSTRPAVLVVGELAFTPPSVAQGQPFQASVTVTNTGGLTATITTATLTFPGTGITAQSNVAQPINLAGGASQAILFTGTVASNTTTGAKDVGVTLAAGTASVTRANAGQLTVTAQSQAAVLTIPTFTLGATSVRPGGTVAATAVVANSGGTAATDLSVTLDFGGATGLTANPASIASLAAGASTTVQFTINVAGSAPAAAANIKAVVGAVQSVTRQLQVLPLPTALTIESVTANPTTIGVAGGTSTITVVVRNATGASTADNVTVTPTATPNTVGQLGTAAAQPIAGGAAANFTFTYTVATLPATQTAVSFNATASGTDHDDLTIKNAGPAATPATVTVGEALLRGLTVTTVAVNPTTALPGDAVTVTVSVQNTGNVTATAVSATLRTTPAAALTNIVPAAANKTGIAAGATEQLVYTANVVAATGPGGVTIDASASGTQSAQTVTDIAATTVANLTIGTARGLVVDTVTASPTTASPGTLVTFTVSVQNTGNVTATGLAVTLSTTAAGVFGTFTPVAQNPAGVPPFGGQATLQFTATVQSGVSPTTAFVDASATATEGGQAVNDPNATTKAAVTITVTPASLTVGTLSIDGKTLSQGQTFDTTFTVANSGQATFTVTSAELAFDKSPISFVGVTVPATIAFGETKEFKLRVTVGTGANLGAVIATATIRGTQVVDPTATSVQKTAAFTVVTPAAISITGQTVQRTTLSVSQTGLVTVTLTNTGGAAASLTAAQLNFSAASTGSLQQTLQTALPPSISAGGNFTLTFQVTGASQGAVTLTTPTLTVKDANSNTDAAVISTAPQPTITVVPLPAVAVVSNSMSDDTISRGQNFFDASAVKVVVSNAGPGPVQLTGANLTFSTAGGITSNAQTSPLPSIPAGLTATIEFVVLVNSSTAAGAYSVTAAFTGTADTAATVNVSASAAFTVQNLPSLTIGTATVSSGMVTTGTAVSVTLPVSNAAQSAVAQLTLVEFPGGDINFQALGTNVTTVSGGATAKLTFTATVTAGATLGPRTVEAKVSYNDANTGQAQAAATNVSAVQFTVQRAPTLSATTPRFSRNGATAAVISRGQTVTLTWSVSNASDAATATVTNVVLGGSIIGGGVTVTSQTTAGNIPTLVGGGFVNYTATLDVNSLAELGGRTATLTLFVKDANPNGTATAFVTKSATLTVQTAPDAVTIGLATFPAVVFQGQRTIPMEIPITNGGANRAAVKITGTTLQFFGPGLTDVSTQYTTVLTPSTQFTNLTIAAGETKKVTYTVSVDQAATMATITLRVTATGTDVNTDLAVTIPAQADKTFAVQGPRASLTLKSLTVATNSRNGAKKYSIGQSFLVTAVVENTGASAATLNFTNPPLQFKQGTPLGLTEFTSALAAGSPSQVGVYGSASITFAATSVATGTTTGVVVVALDLTATNSSDAAALTVVGSGLVTDNLTLQKPASAANFSAQLLAPGAIERTALTTGASPSLFEPVTLTLTEKAFVADARVTALELLIKDSSGASNFTTQFNIPVLTGFDSVAGQTQSTVWNVTAWATARKLELMKLTATATIQDKNSGLTDTVPASDNWFVRDGASAVNGQLDFSSFASGTTSATLNAPSAFVIDGAGRMVVSDTGNHRVLVFPSASATAATTVLGQQTMTSNVANFLPDQQTPNPAQQNLNQPAGIAVDGNRLIVADSGNHRVLYFDNYATRGNYPGANAVIGQPNYFVNAANRFGSVGTPPFANGFDTPMAVAVAGAKLAVADNGNDRVLAFPLLAIDPNTGTTVTASGVFGKDSVVSASPDPLTPTSATVNGPLGITVVNDALVVADSLDNRVLVFTSFAARSASTSPTPINTAQAVFGQLNFTSKAPAATATGLNFPAAVWVAGDKLFVSDRLNHRVVAYDGFAAKAAAGSIGAAAVDVLGQESLTASAANSAPTLAGGPSGFPSATSQTAVTKYGLNSNNGVFTSDGSNVWVADTSNNRLLLVPLP
ncbi:MAG: hypothetical protein HY814_07170 [Candidatus Riflebacteria bacterium]|nr:hypothetical protein [Candidatus Riflebacteria bacterium]